MVDIKFVSYDGAFPNLCRGKLILKINGEIVEFPNCCIETGGAVLEGDNGYYTDSGPWTVVDIPKGYEQFSAEITQCVNDNIEQGCCGGCR